MTDPLLDIIGDKILEEYPEVDKRTCRLLGPTALIVQGLMGVLVILSLVYKRHREKPMRPWKIWMFDVSKQVVGQMFVHGVNVLISDLVAHHSSGNPCVLYFLNILIDTTLGVAIIFVIHRSLTHMLSEKLHCTGFKSGQYGDPPSFWFWARQATVYVFSLTAMKLLVVGLFAVWPGIFKIGAWLLSWTGASDAVQVIVVMGLFPIIMNILQFWLIDSIVKASAVTSESDFQPSPRQSADHEPLMDGDEDYDDGELTSEGLFDIENPPPSSSTSISRESRKLVSKEEGKVFSSGSSSLEASERDSSEELHNYPPRLSSSLSTISSVGSKFEPKLVTRTTSPPFPNPPLGRKGMNLSRPSVIVSSWPVAGHLTSRMIREIENVEEFVRDSEGSPTLKHAHIS